MIAGKKLKLYPYDKVSSVSNEIENRLFTGGSPYDGIEKTFFDYVQSGYTLYDVTASSGYAGLSTVSTGNVLCYYTATPSTAYQTVSSSAVGIHDNVIITGILYSSGVITNYNLDTYLELGSSATNGDFDDKLYLYGLNLYRENNTKPTDSFNINNCTIKESGTNTAGAPMFLSLVNINNSVFYDELYVSNTTNYSINNCEFIANNSTSKISFEKPGNINNVSINGYNSVKFSSSLNTDNNIYVSDTTSFLILGNIKTVFINNTIGFFSTARTAQFKPSSTDKQQFVFGVPSINWDLVDFTDFQEVDADYKTEYVIDNTKFFNTGTRTNYSMTFYGNNPIPDEVKKFSQDQYFFVQREDIETDLASSSGVKSIYNYNFYNTTAASSEYDYSNDENFLIKCYRASDTSQVATFAYFNNQLYPTVFSDVWDDNVYIIENCFMIWEIESITDLKAPIRDKDSKQGITDGPLQGTIRFNNLDNELLEEI